MIDVSSLAQTAKSDERPLWLYTTECTTPEVSMLPKQTVAQFSFDFDATLRIIFNVPAEQTLHQMRDMLFHRLSKRKILLPHSRSLYYFKLPSSDSIIPNTDLPNDNLADIALKDLPEFMECVRNYCPFLVSVIHETQCQDSLNVDGQPTITKNAYKNESSSTIVSHTNRLEAEEDNTVSLVKYKDTIKQLEVVMRNHFYTGLDYLTLSNNYSDKAVKGLKKLEETISEITGPISFTQSNEILQFRNGMARLRRQLDMPNCRISPEYLEKGYKYELPSQKIEYKETFLSLPPKNCPMTFSIHIRLFDGSTLKRLDVSKHHTVKQAILDLIELTTKPSGAKTITEEPDSLSLKIMGRGDYYLPFEPIVSKKHVRNSLAINPSALLEFSLIKLSELHEQDTLQFVEKTLQLLDEYVTPEPPGIPNIPYWGFQPTAYQKTVPYISSWDANAPLSLGLEGIDHILPRFSSSLLVHLAQSKTHSISKLNAGMYVAANVFFGGKVLNQVPMFSSLVWASESPKFRTTLRSTLRLFQIPSQSRICFTLYLQPFSARSAPQVGTTAKPSQHDIPIGWVSTPLYDFRGFLNSSTLSLPLWPDSEANPIGTSTGNLGDVFAPHLVVKFPDWSAPVIFPGELTPSEEEEFLVAEVEKLKRKAFSENKVSETESTTQSAQTKAREPRTTLAFADAKGASTERKMTFLPTVLKHSQSAIITDGGPTLAPEDEFGKMIEPNNILPAFTFEQFRKAKKPLVLPRPRSLSRDYVQLQNNMVATQPKLKREEATSKKVKVDKSVPLFPRFKEDTNMSQIPFQPPMQFSPRLNPTIISGEPLPTQDEWNQIIRVIQQDPLSALDSKARALFLRYKYSLVDVSKALPKFLQSVNWNIRKNVIEVHYLLRRWTPLNPIDALKLLDSRYADPVVREYAVKWIDGFCDEELELFLLQLVQVLKNEMYHSSPLATFLVKRALLSPHTIGHTFFWNLKSELHNKYIAERYGLMIQEYLKGCGSHREGLLTQIRVLSQLIAVANKVIASPKEQGKAVMLAEMKNAQFPARHLLPLSPDFEVSNLMSDKCRVMVSKKRPMWLTFSNAEQGMQSVSVLFKVGDDIRQDQLTLQILSVMDQLWQREGLDMRLCVYHAQTTGNMQGFIEAVKNSATIAAIAKEHDGALGAFKSDPLKRWLLNQQNKHSLSFEQVQENFAYSCAGYCVATYVLGIGDRHNDNIMCTYDGHLFHIDFGHFLGNFKKKFGIEREKAPFIFTPAFALVLGDKGDPMYTLFEDLCVKAFNVLRKHSSLIISLFMMMLSTGIPELRSETDIKYLQRQFDLDKSEEESGTLFRKLIDEARKTTRTQINDFIHIAAN